MQLNQTVQRITQNCYLRVSALALPTWHMTSRKSRRHTHLHDRLFLAFPPSLPLRTLHMILPCNSNRWRRIGDPWEREHLIDRQSLIRVLRQHILHQNHGILREHAPVRRPVLNAIIHGASQELGGRISLIGRVPHQQDKQRHAERVHVRLLRVATVLR